MIGPVKMWMVIILRGGGVEVVIVGEYVTERQRGMPEK